MKKTRLSGLLVAAQLVVCAPVMAEGLYLGGNLGALFLDDDRFTSQQDDTGLLGGLNIGVDNDDYAAEFSLSVSTNIGGADVDLYSLSLYKFLDTREDGNWAPYILGGYTYSSMGRVSYPVDNADSLHLGVGMAKFLSEKWEFRGDLRAYGSFSEETNFGGNPGSLLDFGTMLSLNYHFGSKGATPAATTTVEPASAPAEPEPAPVVVAAPVYQERIVELSVNFNTNADTVISYGAEIEEIADAMNANTDLQLVLEGHTDSRGNADYNKDLSQRRADTVKAKLVNDYSIPASRIRSIGYGEEQPSASNETAQGRAQNRRVVGVLSWEELAE